MDSRKFLGVCLLLSSIILAGSIIWHGISTNKVGRYQSVTLPEIGTGYIVIDTTTGELFSVPKAVRSEELNKPK